MAVGRRAVLASAAASLATPALLRLARADAALPHVTLKLHHAFSSVSCLHANFLAPWARQVEEQSAGRIRIDIYPSMALGGQPAELFDQARDGIVDIVWAMPCETPGRFPKIEMFELPFVPPRRALVGSKAIEDFAAEHLMDEFRDIHPICFSCADRGVLHANRPVRTVAEVKGLRLDVSTRFTAAAVAMLGGHPVPMPRGQLLLAITRHVVDGCIVAWDMVPALKLDSVLKAHTDFADDALSTTTAVLAMNKTAYEKLPADLKQVIVDNSGQVAAGMAGTMWDLKAKAVADAASQNGDQIVTLDPDTVARWRNATQAVVDAWRKGMKAHKGDGDGMLTSARELFAKYASVPEPQPPAPPKPQVTEVKVEPQPPSKIDSPAPAPQPAVKTAPTPAPKVECCRTAGASVSRVRAANALVAVLEVDAGDSVGRANHAATAGRYALVAVLEAGHDTIRRRIVAGYACSACAPRCCVGSATAASGRRGDRKVGAGDAASGATEGLRYSALKLPL